MIKRIALPLAVALMPMLASAQTYQEDVNLITGSKGPAIMCKRVDTAAALTDTDGDATFCSANSLGAINVNIDSTFQSASSPIKVEDGAAASGHSGIPPLAVYRNTATSRVDANDDYINMAANRFGALIVDLHANFQGDSTSGNSPILLEDVSMSEGTALMMTGSRRINSPGAGANPGTDGDAGFMNQSAYGGLWVTPVTSTQGGDTYSLQNALSTTVKAVKASVGTLTGYHCYNPAAAATYIQFFNTAQGSVTLGTTTPVMSFGIPAGGGGNVTWPTGIAFSTAISVAATTTATGSSAPATAADCNFIYK